MLSLSLQAVLGATLIQAMACGFPRPSDIEPDGGQIVSICGNSQIEPGEDCDDGNTIDDGNGCDEQCHKNAICSDHKVQNLFEICDGTTDCSFDCKEITVFLFPVSDRDARYNGTTGTWDGPNPENAMIGDIAWTPPSDGGPLEWRTALEFDLHSMHRTNLLKSSRLTTFRTGYSPQSRMLQVHGYVGDGDVMAPDMTVNNLVGSLFTTGDLTPMSIDVSDYTRTTLAQGVRFMGLLLRLDATTATDPLWLARIALSDNSDPSIHPRLEITYCIDIDNDKKCD